MKFKLGVRLWILIFFILISAIAIYPKIDVSGVEIKSLGSTAKEQGLEIGEIVKEINGQQVNDPIKFEEILEEETKVESVFIRIKTDKNDVSYQTIGNLKFELNNLTIINSEIEGIEDGEILKEINGNKINEVLRILELMLKRLKELILKKV